MNIKTPKSTCIFVMAWQFTGHFGGHMAGSLFITFQSGSQYRWDYVPVHVWATLCRSNSKGKAFLKHIRGRYPSVCFYRPAPKKAVKPHVIRKTAAELRAERTAALLGPSRRRAA